jgi:hypothetical protein
MKAKRSVPTALIIVLALTQAGAANLGQAAPAAEPAGGAPPPLLIVEDDFLPANWTVTADLTGGATYSVTQVLTGGSATPPFRFMSHRLPPVSSGLATVAVTHVFLGDTYDPGVEGAISAIDYIEAGIILSFPFPDAFSTTQPVVVQDGITYTTASFIRFIAVNGSHAWETKSLLQLTADDFTPPGGPAGDHPDFSAAGGPIHFGFVRQNSRSATQPAVPPDQDLVIDQGVDTWRIWVYRQSDEVPNRPPQAAGDIFVLNGYRRSLPLFEIFDVVQNDSDPDGDTLEVTAVTAPLYGSAASLSAHTVVYQLDQARAADSFGYTVSDGALSQSAQVQVIVDCACTVLCLNNLEPPPLGSTTFRAGDALDLPLIYQVRDLVLKSTPQGKQYVDMYYRRNPEILVTLLMNEPLRAEAVAVVELWQPNLANLVSGDGSAVISQVQIDAVESFLSNLAAAASPGLQQVIAGELARLGPLDDYAGLTMREARRLAIGDPTLYFPLALRP